MNNFFIGMDKEYQYEKYKRDFRKGFYGVEVCLLKDQHEIDTLYKKSRQESYKIGIHFPLRENDYVCRDPLFLAIDENEREEAYKFFESEIKFYKSINPEYILMHFPKPGILNDNIDWSCWRFANNKEWIFESKYPEDQLIKNCEAMFKRLSALSEKYDIKFVLENDVTSRLFYKGDFLINLFKRYPLLKMCLDTGRLHLLEQVDKNFDSKEFVRKLAPCTYVLHLWNETLQGNKLGGHYPCLPDLKVEDGWADIEAYLKIIAEINPNVLIKFEHRSDLITDQQLNTCYEWVDSFFKQS